MPSIWPREPPSRHPPKGPGWLRYNLARVTAPALAYPGHLTVAGSHVIVMADELSAGNPAAAVAGQPLPAGTAPVVAADVSAIATVSPATSLARIDPAKVTATAKVDFTNGTQPLPSGPWFTAEVQETYDLRDGQALKTPDYDATFYAYQTPGHLLPSKATATFPMRPRGLFSPAQPFAARNGVFATYSSIFFENAAW